MNSKPSIPYGRIVGLLKVGKICKIDQKVQFNRIKKNLKQISNL